MPFGRGRSSGSKAKSSAARAARARKGHAKRRGKGLFGSTHYKGWGSARTKNTWLF